MSSRSKKKKKFADYVLYQEPGVPVAVVEAKDNNHTVSHGIQQALGYAKIIEVPSASDILLYLYDCLPFQKFTYWSQHLYLFNTSTLETLVRQSGLKIDYIKQIQRYPLSNHLYWLSKGLPGGHKLWSFLDNESLTQAYEASLASIGGCDTLIACIRK